MAKIAIIGTGITGNAAAWLLNQKHDITVFEQNDYAGGHSNTVQSPGYPAVDTGFIVYNEATYPNLIALLGHLDVKTQKTDMSFGVSMNNGQLEYAGDAIFAQKSNLLKPSFYSMLIDIYRFYKNAHTVLENPSHAEVSLGDYLEAKNYSKAFTNNHILPMAAAIWSTSCDDIRSFPIRSFVQFFVNHGLFKFTNRPQWYTVQGGSQRYVEKLTQDFRDKIKLGVRVHKIRRENDKAILEDSNGKIAAFDHIVMACHADQSLEMIADISNDERDVLSNFPYCENTAYLHSDESLMPKRRQSWSSWNYMANTADKKVSLSYWMNRLQPFIGRDQDLFVTLNPHTPPAQDKTLKTIIYHHPQYTLDALKGWSEIRNIQGKNRLWFCGAWCGYGFHEDGLSSGLAVAEALGAPKRPWHIQEISPAGENATPI